MVELGTSVLRAVGRLGGSATLSELSAFVHQPPSKTHRYLQALVASGFIEQDAITEAYRLGAESLSLGLMALAGIDVVSAATAPIAALNAHINETVLLAIWANHGATVVHVKEPLRRVTVVTRVGSVLPLLSSASGLIFAAYLPEEDTPRDAAAERRLKTVRHSGLAAIQGAILSGHRCRRCARGRCRGENRRGGNGIGSHDEFRCVPGRQRGRPACRHRGGH